MADFDVDRPQWAPLAYAEAKIDNAWIAQFAGSGWLSRLIMNGSAGVHSHSAMCRRNKNGKDTIDLLEVREFYGGRMRPLDAYLSTPGRIDFFSPCKDGMYKDKFDPVGAVWAMRRLTAHDYGYSGVLAAMARRVPLLWKIFPQVTSDKLPQEGDPAWEPFCSHAVAAAMQQGGLIDVVPRKPNWLVTPSDLTTSMFFDYEFSLLTPWTLKNCEIAKILCDAPVQGGTPNGPNPDR